MSCKVIQLREMATRGDIWREFGAVILVIAAAVVLLVIGTVPINNYYNDVYGDTFVHVLWGAATVLVAQQHATLVLVYGGLLIAYQYKQPGNQSAAFAAYAGGLFMAKLVELFWFNYVHPSVHPRGKPVKTSLGESLTAHFK